MDKGVQVALRTGLNYAIRTAEDRDTALEIAATALERRIVGIATTSQLMTVAKLFAAVEALTDDERRQAVADAGVRSGQVILCRLDVVAQRRLAATLRALKLASRA